MFCLKNSKSKLICSNCDTIKSPDSDFWYSNDHDCFRSERGIEYELLEHDRQKYKLLYKYSSIIVTVCEGYFFKYNISLDKKYTHTPYDIYKTYSLQDLNNVDFSKFSVIISFGDDKYVNISSKGGGKTYVNNLEISKDIKDVVGEIINCMMNNL